MPALRMIWMVILCFPPEPLLFMDERAFSNSLKEGGCSSGPLSLLSSLLLFVFSRNCWKEEAAKVDGFHVLRWKASHHISKLAC